MPIFRILPSFARIYVVFKCDRTVLFHIMHCSKWIFAIPAHALNSVHSNIYGLPVHDLEHPLHLAFTK